MVPLRQLLDYTFFFLSGGKLGAIKRGMRLEPSRGGKIKPQHLWSPNAFGVYLIMMVLPSREREGNSGRRGDVYGPTNNKGGGK